VIYNKSVTSHSLIYLTPIGETNGAQLTVVKKVIEGEPYFSVSAGTAPTTNSDSTGSSSTDCPTIIYIYGKHGKQPYAVPTITISNPSYLIS
jgi:hypothetical protein